MDYLGGRPNGVKDEVKVLMGVLFGDILLLVIDDLVSAKVLDQLHIISRANSYYICAQCLGDLHAHRA